MSCIEDALPPHTAINPESCVGIALVYLLEGQTLGSAIAILAHTIILLLIKEEFAGYVAC